MNTIAVKPSMQHRESREEMKDSARPKRIPVFEANRNKINVNGLDVENFMYRWVNDVDERLGMFLEGGWEFVDKHGKFAGHADVESARGTGSALKRGMGRGVIAYLMRIPIEFWKEDQAKKSTEEIDVLENSMKESIKRSGDYGSVKIDVSSSRR